MAESEILHIRGVSAQIQAGLRKLAEQENRSVAGQARELLREGLVRRGALKGEKQ